MQPLPGGPAKQHTTRIGPAPTPERDHVVPCASFGALPSRQRRLMLPPHHAEQTRGAQGRRRHGRRGLDRRLARLRAGVGFDSPDGAGCSERPGRGRSRPLRRSERPFHRGGPGPLYWSTYGYSNSRNAQIPEAVWKANIDWIAKDLAPYGYQMVCTDGWIDGDQDVTSHGYIKSLSDDWEHDWAWWANYLKERDMQLGVYYNPLWLTKSAVSDRSIRVVGRPDVAVADLVNDGDWFDGGGQLQWVDATKDGAEEYVKGYVEHFRSVGAVFLRMDFLAWYETGYDQSEGTVGVAHGRDSYVEALRWIHEAAGGDMQLSLVMPNLFDHGAAERLYGDLIRIDNDVDFGTWYQLSDGRQTWQPIWSQWNNAVPGLHGLLRRVGPGPAHPRRRPAHPGVVRP